MRPVLFDTSIYISALRMRDGSLYLRRIAEGAPMWLSAVVLEELFARATRSARRVVRRLERDFDKARRVLVPNLTDWKQTGMVLAQLAVRDDCEQIGQSRLTNDALIATSAGRLGITVVTANARDFAKLAAIRPFSWRLDRAAISS